MMTWQPLRLQPRHRGIVAAGPGLLGACTNPSGQTLNERGEDNVSKALGRRASEAARFKGHYALTFGERLLRGGTDHGSTTLVST
jgi:hypothetical protein